MVNALYYNHNRDINAIINIRTEGLSGIAWVIASIEAITQESYDFNRVECQNHNSL